ncbi:threonylcarbamoyl-AMP synthase [bacterium]|nr:threonylcarbamoyl-AMP synthase [bacterium]
MSRLGTDLDRAVRAIQEGKLVGMPTETVYGLAANAFDEAAVERIFRAKGRPAFDPLIVHTPSIEGAEPAIAHWPESALKLAERFWPGPLTLLLPKSPNLPDLVTSGLPQVGLRCPNHPLALALLEASGCLLAAPSANRFGRTSPTRPEEVLDELGNEVDYVLDGGPCAVGIESTVLEIDPDGSARVLRLGGLPVEALEEALGSAVPSQLSSSRPSAPGMLYAHYSPGIPVRLMRPEDDPDFEEPSGFIAYQNPSARVRATHTRILSPDGSLERAASGLFRALRELGQHPLRVIYADTLPDWGLGPAINDRLRRAAAAR